jgi:hypothetical protein
VRRERSVQPAHGVGLEAREERVGAGEVEGDRDTPGAGERGRCEEREELREDLREGEDEETPGVVDGAQSGEGGDVVEHPEDLAIAAADGE